MEQTTLAIVLAATFSIFSGISKAVCDTVASTFYKSKLFLKYGLSPKFWDKHLGSKNKWKNGDKKQGEAFLGSSTVFVIFTDGWHITDFLRDAFFVLSFYALMFSGLPLQDLVIALFILFAVKQIIFQFTYFYLNR